MFVLSDFKFPDVIDFSLGNLDPQFEMIGDPAATNLGIVEFTTRRHEKRPDQIQAFARLENFSLEPVNVTLELYLDDGADPIDARQTEIPGLDPEEPGKNFATVAFTLDDIERGVLRLTHDHVDALAVDNAAWAVVNVPRRARLLFVSSGNVAMERALRTRKAEELAEIDFGAPSIVATEDYLGKADSGFWDLIIYDRCVPKGMPQANTLFIGQFPPDKRWEPGQTISVPQIIDSDRTHPLMQLLDLGNVDILESYEVKPPAGGTVLIESNKGPIFAVGPRDGLEDAVLGFDFERAENDGSRYYNTNWPLRRSFPVFVQEVITYLGGQAESLTTASVVPGQPFEMHLPGGPEQLQVTWPDGSNAPVRRGRQNRYTVTQTDQLGVYEIALDGSSAQRFAVNLFDPLESDIAPVSGKAVKRIGNVKVDVSSQPNWQTARFEGWKLLALLGLGVLVLEWYIYNRRVYV